jgi:4-hydroxyphenylacetate 3-monooxygenase
MGARTGDQYLKEIRAASPEFWYGRERVADTTAHVATAATAREVARLYDMQHEDDLRELMLFESPTTGDAVGTQFLVPRSQDDLVRRRRAHKVWADSTFGFLGRSTDFVSAMLTAWNINADFFGENAQNVRDYFELIRERDLYLTHILIDPPVDRSQPPSKQPDPYTCLGVVDETSEGLIVSGAKMLATAGPYSDELLCWPFGQRGYGEDDKKYAISFAIPTNTPGLRFIAREPYAGGNRFDHPLASRYDEMDAVAVFEDVLIPWERVFINQDPEQVNRIWAINSNAFTGVQTSARFLSKLQFIAGLARRATQIVNTDQFPHVRDLLGEITVYIELTKAALVAADATAEPNAQGIYIPNVQPLFAVRNSANRWYPRVREILHVVLAGGLMYQPADVTSFDSPVRADVEKFYRGATATAEERIKVFKAASDVAVSSFGGRHELYERFYAGDPMFLRIATQFLQYDWSEPLELADALLDSYSVDSVLEELREGDAVEAAIS